MHPQPKYKNSAAFYDVDGTLIKINIVHAFAFYASRHASLGESARRTIKTALSIPVFWAADKLSRKWFNEIFYRSYEGASEDRLVVLAEELFEDVIKPNIYPRAQGPDRGEPARRACRQVLVSGALDFTMRPLARYLGVDDLIANQLEFVDNYATGKLKKPFVAGATKADIMRAYAKRARHRSRRVVGVHRQLQRLPDARRRRSPDRVQPRLPPALDGARRTTGRCSISTRSRAARPRAGRRASRRSAGCAAASGKTGLTCAPFARRPARTRASTSSRSTPTRRRASCSTARTS